MYTLLLTAVLLAAATPWNAAFSAESPKPPKGYVFLCNEGETCNAGASAKIAYGAKEKFVYRVLCGTFTCNTLTLLEDPIPSESDKACFIPEGIKTTMNTSSLAVDTDMGDGTGADPDCKAGAVIENKTIDCKGKTLGLGCKATGEHQPAVLELHNATVKNLRIAKDGGSDGIHCKEGDCTLINVVWEDICEDAATNLSEGGTMKIVGGSVTNTKNGPGGIPDKIFQHNSKNSTMIITGGFRVIGDNGKLWRSCGNCANNGGPRHVIIDNIIIEGTLEGEVAGVNQNFGDTATITNLKIKNYQKGNPPICIEWQGGQEKNHNQSINTAKKEGESFNSKNCIVKESDITSY